MHVGCLEYCRTQCSVFCCESGEMDVLQCGLQVVSTKLFFVGLWNLLWLQNWSCQHFRVGSFAKLDASQAAPQTSIGLLEQVVNRGIDHDYSSTHVIAILVDPQVNGFASQLGQACSSLAFWLSSEACGMGFSVSCFFSLVWTGGAQGYTWIQKAPATTSGSSGFSDGNSTNHLSKSIWCLLIFPPRTHTRR